MRFLYLAIDVGSILLPLLFSFHSRIRLDKEWKSVAIAIAIPALVFCIWDNWFTGMAVWGFNPNYITGIQIFRLPLEEVLFFICIPYACLFLYVIISRYKPVEFDPTRVTIVLIVGLLLSGYKYLDRWYPAVTFLALAAMLIVLFFVLKVNFLAKFYWAYLFVLIPFFIVNGILTGTGLPEPVVWYDNTENLGIRMWTIPVEDVFYGMLLILMNVTLYEKVGKRVDVLTCRGVDV